MTSDSPKQMIGADTARLARLTQGHDQLSAKVSELEQRFNDIHPSKGSPVWASFAEAPSSHPSKRSQDLFAYVRKVEPYGVVYRPHDVRAEKPETWLTYMNYVEIARRWRGSTPLLSSDISLPSKRRAVREVVLGGTLLGAGIAILSGAALGAADIPLAYVVGMLAIGSILVVVSMVEFVTGGGK